MKGYICRATRPDGGCSLNGKADVPSCSNSSCIALVVAAQSVGVSRLYGVSKDSSVLNMIGALQSLGIRVTCDEACVVVEGVGVGGFARPETAVNVGNSSLVSCVILSILSTHPFTSFIVCDGANNHDSGVVVPGSAEMQEIMGIFSSCGAKYLHNDTLPVLITGIEDSPPVALKNDITSEIVKTAVLLGCTNIAGKNFICAQGVLPTYTEWLLARFGADISTESQYGSDVITIQGQKELFANDVRIFQSIPYVLYVVAAAMVLHESSVEITGAFVDKTAQNVLDIFVKMGGDLSFSKDIDGLIDINIKSSELMGIDIDCYELRSVLSELPIICVICACSEGISRIYGLSELKGYHREVLEVIVKGMEQCGIAIKITDDLLEIQGRGRKINGGAVVDALDDYRIAIPFLILGFITYVPLVIKGPQSKHLVDFVGVLNGIGGKSNFSMEFV